MTTDGAWAIWMFVLFLLILSGIFVWTKREATKKKRFFWTFAVIAWAAPVAIRAWLMVIAS